MKNTFTLCTAACFWFQTQQDCIVETNFSEFYFKRSAFVESKLHRNARTHPPSLLSPPHAHKGHQKLRKWNIKSQVDKDIGEEEGGRCEGTDWWVKSPVTSAHLPLDVNIICEVTFLINLNQMFQNSISNFYFKCCKCFYPLPFHLETIWEKWHFYTFSVARMRWIRGLGGLEYRDNLRKCWMSDGTT